MEKILDIALVAILVICAWAGYKKGLIMGVGGVLVIIVSVYMANLVSNTFSYEVIPALRPFISGYMETSYKMAIYDELEIEIPVTEESGLNIMDIINGIGGNEDESTAPPSSSPSPSPSPSPSAAPDDDRLTYSLDDLIRQNPEIERTVYVETLKSFGFFTKPANIIADEIIEYGEKNDAGRFNSLVDVICARVTYVIGFVISFLLVLIILTVVGNILNLSFKIPGLDILNDISGAIFGVITGLMLCVVLVWALKFAGAFISEEKMSKSTIAMWFMNRDILAGFLGL